MPSARTLLPLAAALLAGSALSARAAELVIESWRNDDLPVWQEKIIPAFEKVNPGIKVVFSPTAPTEYNAALNARLRLNTVQEKLANAWLDHLLEKHPDILRI